MSADISYLKRMRTGQPPHKIVTLGNGSDAFDVAVVLLSSDEMLTINEEVEERYRPVYDGDTEIRNPKDSQKNRMSYYNKLLCYNCTRVPDMLDVKVASDVEEIGALLDDEDIKRICEQYNELLINKAPKLEVLTEEELDQLKKYLEVTSLKDISTVSLVSEQCLTSNGSGSLSIKE